MGTRTHRGLSTRDHNYLAVGSTSILVRVRVFVYNRAPTLRRFFFFIMMDDDTDPPIGIVINYKDRREG